MTLCLVTPWLAAPWLVTCLRPGGIGASLRARMVAHLRERGSLTDPRVAAVLGRVPRHVFVPGVDLPEAYADEAIVTRYRDGWPVSSASQPAMVAAMLEQLRPPEGGSVLEIGAGTGYNAALLSALVGASGRVVSIDIDPEVAEEARGHLAQAGAGNVEVICGDGAQGWPAVPPTTRSSSPPEPRISPRPGSASSPPAGGW